MKKIVFALALAGALSGCNSDGTLKPGVKTFVGNIVTASCQVDQAVPGLVAQGALITALVAPEYAPEVELATKVEQLAHPAVVAACNAAAAAQANGAVNHPVAVTVAPSATMTPATLQ